MSSPFKMELSSWSHGNCDINTWSSQESCHLMRTWSLLAALSAAAGGNSWLLLAAAVVLLRCCGQGTDPSAAADAEEQSGALLCLPGSPITTFYDKTPELQAHCDHFMSLTRKKLKLTCCVPACWWRLVTWRAVYLFPWRLKWKKNESLWQQHVNTKTTATRVLGAIWQLSLAFCFKQTPTLWYCWTVLTH